MKSSYQFDTSARKLLSKLLGRKALFVFLLLAACLAAVQSASAQVIYSGDKGGFTLAAGGTASGYQVQFGQQKLIGFAGVVDADTSRRFGVEAEGRWLAWNNPTQIQVKTWMGGPRYHHTWGKWQVYGKGLVGIGQFTFTDNLAHGNYLVIAPGAGVDYRWKRRISFRVADVEYQVWPQFTFGSMTSVGVSAGVRYHIF
jgi:hypothetical protein